MMPVVPTAKRAHGFTIDSLMSKDRPRSRSRSPPMSRLRPPSTSPEPVRTTSASSTSTPVNLTASAEAAIVPGLEGRIFPGHHLNGGFHPLHNNPLILNSIKGLYGPSEHGSYPDGLTAAAALGFPIPMGANPAAPHGLPAGFSPGHPGLGAAHPLLLGAAGHREHFSLYPWLMSRHGGYFGHGRFPGHDAGLLLQPFRKPKRIRTAFSPSQLLRLEHAFEKNHYVVGQERKDLAINLNLTETQVKVWFQNRRTKYKRMKAEEAENQRGDGGGGHNSKSPKSPGGGSRSDGEDKPLDISSNPEDDEELEMELIDDEEDEEIDCVTHNDDEINLVRSNLAMENAMQNQRQLLEQHQQQSEIAQSHGHFKGQNHLHFDHSHHNPSSPRSASPSTAKTAHHVERWRTETSQVQVA